MSTDSIFVRGSGEGEGRSGGRRRFDFRSRMCRVSRITRTLKLLLFFLTVQGVPGDGGGKGVARAREEGRVHRPIWWSQISRTCLSAFLAGLTVVVAATATARANYYRFQMTLLPLSLLIWVLNATRSKRETRESTDLSSCRNLKFTAGKHQADNNGATRRKREVEISLLRVIISGLISRQVGRWKAKSPNERK